MGAVAEAAREAAARQLERFRAEMAAESARMQAALAKQVHTRRCTNPCMILDMSSNAIKLHPMA